MRSVASLELAAGLPGPRGSRDGVGDDARSCAMDRSYLAKRFMFDRSDLLDRSDMLDRSDLRRGAMLSGTAVSTQNHIEIVFDGSDSSCYPWFSLGAEGIVSSTSRSPK